VDIWTFIQDLREKGLIKQSRFYEFRSTAKLFARALDYPDPASCPLEELGRDPGSRSQIIEELLKERSPYARRNAKSNLSYLARAAADLGLLNNTSVAEISDTHHVGKKSWKPLPSLVPKEGIGLYRKPYSLPLNLWPEKLGEQYATWKAQVTADVSPKASAYQKYRRATVEAKTRQLQNFFGYLYYVRGLRDLDLMMITDVAVPKPGDDGDISEFVNLRNEPSKGLLEEYIDWYKERAGGESVQAREIVVLASSLCNRYFFPKALALCDTAELARVKLQATALRRLRARLPSLPSRLSPDERTVTMKELWEAANLEFPNKNGAGVLSSGTKKAARAGRALSLMLLLSYPLRPQNYRGAKVGKHLLNVGGRWFLHFTGEDEEAGLKSLSRMGERNVYHEEVTGQVLPYLREYLEVWRPLLLGSKNRRQSKVKPSTLRGTNAEANIGQEYLLLNALGQPLTAAVYTMWIESVTYNWLGKRINPGTIRKIVARWLVGQTRDIELVARLMNNSPETVRREYA
jgi:hypothetical protein